MACGLEGFRSVSPSCTSESSLCYCNCIIRGALLLLVHKHLTCALMMRGDQDFTPCYAADWDVIPGRRKTMFLVRMTPVGGARETFTDQCKAGLGQGLSVHAQKCVYPCAHEGDPGHLGMARQPWGLEGRQEWVEGSPWGPGQISILGILGRSFKHLYLKPLKSSSVQVLGSVTLRDGSVLGQALLWKG